MNRNCVIPNLFARSICHGQIIHCSVRERWRLYTLAKAGPLFVGGSPHLITGTIRRSGPSSTKGDRSTSNQEMPEPPGGGHLRSRSGSVLRKSCSSKATV